MCASLRATSAPNSSRTDGEKHSTVAELNLRVPVQSGKTQFPPVNNQMIPDELLVSLTSSSRSSLGHASHDHQWKVCGVRRPDAVWHHQHGRKKYKHFLEQPTTLSGAGRDISFLCDAMVTHRKTTPLPPLTNRNSICDTKNSGVSESLVPEEYRLVENKGLESLELYEDAFTMQLQDEEQRLRVFPSLRPGGRLEVVQLMRMMDDMLMKAGVGQQSEELTELSQMEGLLSLVQVEQNIYNIVFHELIRQVSVGCAERGQLLAKLRQHYQSLLVRIPSHLKALHTEAVAQRALDHRLTEEIHRIKTSIQTLNTELSTIREHDAFVSQQAKHAHQQLAAALVQTHTNSDVVHGYHELYELQRSRLEAQLLQMTEDRDCWSRYTFCLALKVISVKKLQPISQLHICKQRWSKTAEHISLYITTKDTAAMKIIMELSDQWKEQLTAFMSQLERTEHAQCEQLRIVQQSITKWLDICSTQNQCSDPKSERATLEQLHADLKDWSNVLALQLECYQGEKIVCRQETLGELDHVQKRWLDVSNQLFSRHPSPVGEPPGGQQDLTELEQVLCELLKQLDMHVSGGGGIHGQITALLRLMESWAFKIGTMTGRPEMMSVSDWLTLQEALRTGQILAQKALQDVLHIQTENEKDKKQPDTYREAGNVCKKVKVFVTSLSNFSESENRRLSEEISSLHITQTRWMLDLLLLMVPDHSEDQNVERDQSKFSANISLVTLEENAKMLAEKLNRFSTYITSSCKLIVEEQILQNPSEAEGEHEMNECKKLQSDCIDWVETCSILLSGVKGDREAGHAPSSDAPLSPAGSKPTAGGHETQQDISKEELTVGESPVVKLIGYDGNIVQRKLGESSVHLNGTEELVVSPVTEGAQKAFRDLTTVALLQKELQDSELRVQIAERRALKAEEALQAAMDKIHDLERNLQDLPRPQPTGAEEEKETTPPSPKPVTQPVPPRKTSAEASTRRSSTRRSSTRRSSTRRSSTRRSSTRRTKKC